MKNPIPVVLLVSVLAAAWSVGACTTIVVGKDVSATGRVIVGHNEDDDAPVWQAHSLVPARDWPADSVVPAEANCCGRVPQVAHTHALYWSEARFKGGDGNADCFCNEKGVLVTSNSGGRSRERDDDPGALTEGGVGHLVRRCVGERATSARDAVRIIGELVERYGYHHSARIYTVADKDEAWMVQVVHGRNYCAVRCPDDKVTVLPNCYPVNRVDAFAEGEVVCSKDLLENARRKGFWDGVSPFDFAAAYQGRFAGDCAWLGLSDSNAGRYRQAILQLTGEDWSGERAIPFGVRPKKARIGMAEVKAVLTGHSSPQGNGIRHSPESFAICRSWTIESFVCELTPDPLETRFSVSIGPGCENPYRTFRPFRGEIPSDLDRPDPVGRLASHVSPVESK